MKILLSNDDGYRAEGLAALGEAIRPLGTVTIVAPDRNRSGASNSLTLDVPVRAVRYDADAFFVNGTPTDCVHVALTGMLDYRPDLVVSGINNGPNMGDDTLYSGTVAAATEAYLFGIPAIAFSQAEHDWTHLDAAARVARDIVLRHFDGIDSPYLLNVNIPCLPYERIGKLTPTRLGRRHQSEGVIRARDPRGREIFWIGPPGACRDAGEGTDFHATAHGMVSITPLQVDLTHKQQLEQLVRVLA